MGQHLGTNHPSKTMCQNGNGIIRLRRKFELRQRTTESATDFVIHAPSVLNVTLAGIRNINNILRKNRRILTELNPDQKSKLQKDKMLSKGFDFNYYTNTYTTKTGSIYYFCYEQGYLSIGNDYYALVVKKEFVD